MKDFDDRLVNKISKDFGKYFTNKLEYPNHPKDKYRVIGGTHIYPDGNIYGGLDLDPLVNMYYNLKEQEAKGLLIGYNPEFLKDYIERRIEYQKNQNRLKTLEQSRWKYEIYKKEFLKSFKHGKASWPALLTMAAITRPVELFCENQAQIARASGMDSQSVELLRQFSEGMVAETVITSSLYCLAKLRNLEINENIVGCGAGNLHKITRFGKGEIVNDIKK